MGRLKGKHYGPNKPARPLMPMKIECAACAFEHNLDRPLPLHCPRCGCMRTETIPPKMSLALEPSADAVKFGRL